jgi:AraC-like DNA-binding protein
MGRMKVPGRDAQVETDPEMPVGHRHFRVAGTEVLAARFVAFDFAPHAHDEWSFALVTEGANRYRRERMVESAPAGTVCLVNPGEVHTGGGAVMTYINVRPPRPVLADLLPEIDFAKAGFVQAVFDDRETVARLGHMFRAIVAEDGPLDGEAALTQGLGYLFARHGGSPLPAPPGLDHPRLKAIRDLIEARLAEPLLLGEVAGHVGLSRFHLTRSFAAATGFTIQAYLRWRRVERAKSLIQAGLPLAEASLAAGFSDQAHMTRLFKRMTGVTPARWRS